MGSQTHRLQSELWKRTVQLYGEDKLPGAQAGALNLYVAALMETETSPDLKQALQEIREVERVLVALNNIFHYCRRKDAIGIVEVIQQLEAKDYSYRHLPEVLPNRDFQHKTTIQMALNALKKGDYRDALQQIFKLNADVMKHRGGAAWVELESSGKLRVRVKSETASLATAERLEQHWDYDYFLGSYLSMARTYLEGAHG